MKIISTIVNIITILITVVMVSIIVLYIVGIKPTVITSGSMVPTIPVGSVCFINTKEPYEKIEKENIIVYKIPKQKVIHRVIGTEEKGFRTKGDANEYIDTIAVTKDMYYGKYLFSIPYLGYLSTRLQSTTGRIIFVTILIVLYIVDYLFLYAQKKGEQNGGNK